MKHKHNWKDYDEMIAQGCKACEEYEEHIQNAQLKTLKDFPRIDNNLVGEIIARDLRAEAIKWIKYRITQCDNCFKFSFCEEHKFWSERFNITDEELNAKSRTS